MRWLRLSGPKIDPHLQNLTGIPFSFRNSFLHQHISTLTSPRWFICEPSFFCWTSGLCNHEQAWWNGTCPRRRRSNAFLIGKVTHLQDCPSSPMDLRHVFKMIDVHQRQLYALFTLFMVINLVATAALTQAVTVMPRMLKRPRFWPLFSGQSSSAKHQRAPQHGPSSSTLTACLQAWQLKDTGLPKHMSRCNIRLEHWYNGWKPDMQFRPNGCMYQRIKDIHGMKQQTLQRGPQSLHGSHRRISRFSLNLSLQNNP